MAPSSGRVEDRCTHPDPQVVITLVIDLAGHVDVAADELPDRLETRGGCRYEKTSPTTFEWRSPGGHRFRRDHTGTLQHDHIPQP